MYGSCLWSALWNSVPLVLQPLGVFPLPSCTLSYALKLSFLNYTQHFLGVLLQKALLVIVFALTSE